MANSQINRSLEFANMQMAAEAFLLQVGDGGVLPGSDVIKARLEDGNFHASHFMPVQAQQFVDRYEVLAQYRNDPLLAGGAGFSGTLFRNRGTGELTLSFRSTEFIDDAVRDGKATNELEIKDLGWAFGQIAEMEAWYVQLRQDPTLLGGQNFNVTGYSLGGHLATAFSILRREEYATGPEFNPVLATYTFNGAGTGAILHGGRLTDLLADFNRIRANYAASPEWNALSQAERDTYLASAQLRINEINDERFRVADLSGVTRAFAASAPTGSQTLLAYQIAALLVHQNTAGSSNFPLPGGTNDVPSDPVFAWDVGLEGISNMVELVGSDGGNLGPSFVSNSGIHFGNRQTIYIEDQPLTRGTYSLLLHLGDLISSPDQNNFADTHSLVLIVDSLSLMAAMEELAPTLTMETAGQVLAAMSNASASRLPGTQGKAEGDTLERMLDALRNLVLGPGQESSLTQDQMLQVLEGNTWHENVYRMPFHENLKVLGEGIEALVDPNEPFVFDSLLALSSEQLTAIAESVDALAYRYALRELNPFAVIGDTASAVLYAQHNLSGELELYNAVDRTGTLTTEWITDRSAFLLWKNWANTTNVSLLQSDQTTEPWRFEDLSQNYKITIVQPGGTAVEALTHRALFGGDGTEALHGGSVFDRLYGGAATDYLEGRGGNDYLEGGSGLDIYQYNGYAGIIGSNDASDTVRDTDGTGVLRYVFHDNPVAQTSVIADASIKLSNTEWSSADGRFLYERIDTDLVITINDGAGGTITLKDFRDGDFGIRLLEARPAPQTTNTINVADYPDNQGIFDTPANDLILGDDRNNGINASTGGSNWVQAGGGRDMVYALTTSVEDAHRIEGGTGDDLLTGGPGNDELYASVHVDWAQAITTGNGAGNGLHGDWLSGDWGDDVLVGDVSNDGFAGGMGKDLVIAGAGDDNVFGDADWVGTTLDWFYEDDPITNTRTFYWFNGSENYDVGDADVIYTGSGNDYVWAGGGDDLVWGEAGADQLIGQSGSDMLIGGAGDDRLWGDDGRLAIAQYGGDYLDGGAGNDALHGEAGNDVLIGGAGNDTLRGGSGKDIYVFNRGDGTETIFDIDTSSTSPDATVLVLGEGVLRSEIKFSVGSLVVDIGGGDRLHFDGFDQVNPTASTPLGEIRLSDGTSLSYADILAQGFDIDGTEGDDNNDIPAEPRNLVGTGVVDRIRGLGGNDLLFGLVGSDMLDGGAGIDTLQGGDGDDQLFGGDDNDTLFGESDNDALNGESGDDQLVGSAGNDTLDGGAGNDNLFGQAGNDVYVFGRGYGLDIISDEDTTPGNIDAVQLAADITSEDVSVTISTVYADSLELSINGTSDRLILGNQTSATIPLRTEEIRFADGTVWTPSTTPLLIRGTVANNSLTGTSGPNVFEGLAGNDTMSGGAGNDTYRIFRGDGADLISDSDATVGNVDKVLYAADILPSQVQASRSGNNLVLRPTGTADQVTISNYFQNDGATSFLVEQIKFLADGTVWNYSTTRSLVLTPTENSDSITGFATADYLYGLGGNDNLNGGGGNDTLDGGTGNDNLRGEANNDIYLFARGGGQDVIVDGTTDIDTVRFAADILPSDISIRRHFDDLILEIAGTTDQVSLSGSFNYFSGDDTRVGTIEQIDFTADGTLWTFSALAQQLLAGTAGDDVIWGYASDDFITGGGGNDNLSGHDGNDTLTGGIGNDFLNGDKGNDVYRISRGEGQDRISETDLTHGNGDTLELGVDIVPSDVEIVRDPLGSSQLVLRVSGTTDQVMFSRDLFEQIKFLSDGTIWDFDFIRAMSLLPTEGDDVIEGYATDDYLLGLGGNDYLSSNDGNDTLSGGAGTDSLRGGKGSDTYLFARGDGQDTILNWYFEGGTFVPKIDALQFASDIAPSDVILTKSGLDLLLSIAGGPERIVLQWYFPTSGRDTMEEIRFADGTIWNGEAIDEMLIGPPINGTAGADTLQGTEISEAINGSGGNDTVYGSSGNDTIDGGLGSDQLHGESGNDVLIAGSGEASKATVSNVLRGGSGNDVLVSSGKTDFLYGEAGNDILLGAAARDWLEDVGGNNLLMGGATIDDVNMGDQNDLVIGGTGDDLIDGDKSNVNGIRGLDILAFNKSDGKDSASRLGTGSTISIGGGTVYSNLSFEVVGTTLRLKTASSHYISLNDWFGSSANRTVSTLQIVIEGTSNYNASSSNPMNNKKVQTFDFLGLVAAWDAAGRPRNFSIANNLATYRIGGSDTDMIGGAIAYQYARTGNLGMLTYSQMQAVINDAAFGVSAQSITPVAGLAALDASATADTTSTDLAVASLQATTDTTTFDTGVADENGASVVDDAAVLPDAPLEHAPVLPGQLVPQEPELLASHVPHAVPGLGSSVPGQPSQANGSRTPPVGDENLTAAKAATNESSQEDKPDVGAERAGSSAQDESDALLAQWFERSSQNDDLTLLDDILRGESSFEEPANGSVAAAWEASHRWLSRNASASPDCGEALGADTAGLSFLGGGNAVYDMPRAAVGLQEVSGHALKSFRGLREGMSVLTQS